MLNPLSRYSTKRLEGGDTATSLLPLQKKMIFIPKMSAKFCARFVLKSAINFEFCAPTFEKMGVEPPEEASPTKPNFDPGMGIKFCARFALKKAVNFECFAPIFFEKMGGWHVHDGKVMIILVTICSRIPT